MLNKLGELLHGVLPRAREMDWAQLDVGGVQDDSRRVQPGDLFVAQQGLTVDGHAFAAAAVRAGAVAVVAQRALPELTVPVILCDDPARALAVAAARLAGDPAAGMRLLGITGTNGKTTTTYLMEGILRQARRSPGVIGTVAYRYGETSEAAPFTTPTPLVLQQVLGQMQKARCTDVVMEVSSHALQLGRVWGLDFQVAAFTHLTQDHLDLHGSMESYLEAKLLLFSRHLRAGGSAVVNVDGHGAERVVATVRQRGDVELIRCSSRGAEAEAQLLELQQGMEGLRATLSLPSGQVEVRSPIIGDYNADNILMAAACCHAAGVPLDAVARGIGAVAGVPGRLERVSDPSAPFAVLVDYAHTPDALERAMQALRPLCPGRLIVVFGCGGDRDRSKRPLMGGAVARIADLALVTSDNPRTEDPLAIIDEVLVGVRQQGIARVEHPQLEQLEAERGYLVQPDRAQAIAAAVQAARAGDMVLIAGKGHEDYQILGTRRIHFDDREQARAALSQRGA